MNKTIKLSPALKDCIMREVTEQLDKLLDAEEYEFGVYLSVEVHHAEINLEVGGRPQEDDA